MMRSAWAVYRRELAASATRWSSYVGGAVFAGGLGAAFALGPSLEAGFAPLGDVFAALPWLLAVLAPAPVAAQWGREAGAGLLETFAGAPIPGWALAVGKWAAATTIVWLWLLSIAALAISLSALGRFDAGAALAAAVGAAFAAGAYCAIASAFGPLSVSAPRAYVASALACLAITIFGWSPARDAAALVAGDFLARALAEASTPTRLEAARLGVLTLADGFYFASLTALGVLVAGLGLSARREWIP